MGLLDESFVSYVNLEHRKDRLEHITNELKRVGIEAERTPGMYPHEFDENDPRHQKMRNRTVGAIGCYESQLNVMREALKRKKSAIVLEDDVKFCDDVHERFAYIENWMNQNPQYDPAIFWFGGTFHVGGRGPYHHTHTIGRDAEKTSDPRIFKCYGAFSTHAYWVNYKYLAIVIEMLERCMKDSIGIDYSCIHYVEPFLNTYAMVPGIAKQIDNISDQVPGKNHVTKFSNFERLNGSIENSRYWWQPLMSDFDPTTFFWAEADLKNRK